MPPPPLISWGIQSLKTCKKRFSMALCKKVVWFSSLYRKGPGRKICRKVWPCSCKRLSYDICNVFVGHFWSQSYQLINLPLIHKQHSPKYGNVSSCYGHNSSPIPWPGFWNPTLNCIKSLTGLLVEGRRLCIGRPANRGVVVFLLIVVDWIIGRRQVYRQACQ